MAPERPNLLLITTDQQRFDALGRAGNASIFTPHLNWLVDQGICFSRAYSDCPICVPARATIMTGRHGYRQGLINNGAEPNPLAQHPTLPALLTEAGYHSRAVGKMHFHPMRACYGFEHMELPYDYLRQLARDGGGQPWDHGLGQNDMEPGFSTVEESRSLTRWIVDQSVNFLETRDPTRPFFLWTSFTKPHPPFDCDPKYWSLYDNITMPGRTLGDWSATWDQVPTSLRGPTLSLNRSHLFSDEQLAAVKRAYYACVSQVDYNLGLLFARLREMRLLESTWIVFTSDHGEMLGDHWLGAKSVLLEPSAHVPLIVRPPAADWRGHEMQGVGTDALACLADLLPTFLARAGVEVPDGVDGIDLLELVNSPGKRGQLVGACGDFAAILSERFKLHRSWSDGVELLFDLETDPMERRNLIGAPEHDEQRQRLTAALLESIPEAMRSRRRPDAEAAAPAPRGRWPGFHSRQVPSDVLH